MTLRSGKNLKSPVLQKLEPSEFENQKGCTDDENGKNEDIKEVYSDPELETVHKEDRLEKPTV